MNRFEDTVKRITVNPVIRNIGRVIDKRNFPGAPIFITASPRSGTTLLLSIIGAHPNIFAVPEQTYAFDRWARVYFREYRYYPYRIDRLYRYFIFHGYDKNANRWCEKTPRHVESIERIASFYRGRVKIINIFRDGRDVIVSRHPKHRPDEYWVTVNRWLKSVKCAWELRDKDYLYNVYYEDIVQDYRTQIENICRFVEEPYTESMENWIRNTNVKRSKHLGGAVQQVHASAVGKWKRPEHRERVHRFLKNEEAVEMMRKLGYM